MQLSSNCAISLITLGGGLACLVFASARRPGGGFLTGAQAQEESIARASAFTRAYARSAISMLITAVGRG